MPAPESVRRILVTAYGHIGDMLPVGPALRVLRATYPQARISLLALNYAREIMAACPYLDEFIGFEDFKYQRGTIRGKIERILSTARLVPRLYRRFDMVLILHIPVRFLTPLSWLIGAKVRAGFLDAALPAWLLTHRARPLAENASYMDVNRAVLEAIGLTSMPDSLELWPTAQDEQAVQALLNEHQVAADDLLIGLHPGSHWTCQQWSPKEWASLADALVARYGARLIISGTAEEQGLVSEISKHMQRQDARPIDATGRTNISQFATLMRRLDLLICVNSAAPKLALAMQTPTLNLVGYESHVWTVPASHVPLTVIRGCDDSTAVAEWCPYGIFGKVSQCHRAECVGIGGLSLITPAMVLRQVESKLSARRGAPQSTNPIKRQPM